MQTIPISTVTIPEGRQRTAIPEDHIASLLSSISASGLIVPIVLRDGSTLVAGECRLSAVKMLYTLGGTLRHAGQAVPPGEIPYIDFGALTKLQQMEVEYAENAHRRDLPWQDNAKAIALLHELRTAQAVERGERQTFSDTAQEVFKAAGGHYTETVSSSVIAAKHLADPDVAKAKNAKEAAKIITRKADTARREMLAAAVGRVSISDRMKVYNAEAVSWLKECSNEQFDVILTDPPYGMDADSFGDAAGRMAGIEHEYEDSRESAMGLMLACIPEWYRVAKAEAHLYLWCDVETFIELREACRAAGWWTFRTPLVNVKPEGGRVPWPEHGPRRSYELCLFAVKGKKPVVSIRPDVFESRLVEGNLGHGAQKPVEAYVELLKRSVRPGDTVLDSFAGTGTIFAAAQQLGLSATGTEFAAAAYGICLERIAGLK